MMQRTRIKLCGFTRENDVRAAVRAGTDALGMIFFAGSRRALDLAQAEALRQAVPAFVDVVALFVNPDPGHVREVVDTVMPDLLQFHGDESPQECERYGRRYMRAFRIGAPGLATPGEVLAECRRYGSASAWLFDSHSAGYGGSGKGFDLGLLAAVRTAADARPIVLAGGLAPGNVEERVRTLRPYAVDVSSGIEDAPGVKSAEKIHAFVRSVRNADAPLD
ncbi:phosphoribosylanthranilate isomerase [Alcaligenaceae bacterium]|nr:phosphoribosylanthranilate isomerase [Alcaligenaceae bacterium]